MSLLDEFRKEYCVIEKTRIPDGESGFITEWREGVRFTASEAHNTTIEAQVAEQNSTASTYTFLIDKSLELGYGDVIKRLDDGQVFRITQPSGEDVTPAMSRMHLTKVMAEKWSLPS